MKTTKFSWNIYVISLSGERYCIITQEQFITLSGKNNYIIRQQV